MSTSGNSKEPNRKEDERPESKSALLSSSVHSAGSERKGKRGPMAGENLELNSMETTMEGQLELNPHFTVEEAQEAAKKEYNRRNSARSRVRNKKMVSHLQDECARLSRRVKTLTSENERIRAELEVYKKREASGIVPNMMMVPVPFNPPFNGAAMLPYNALPQGVPFQSNNVAALQASLASLQGGSNAFVNTSMQMGNELLQQQLQQVPTAIPQQSHQNRISHQPQQALLNQNSSHSHYVSSNDGTSQVSSGPRVQGELTSSSNTSDSGIQQGFPGASDYHLAQLSPRSRARLLESMTNDQSTSG